VTCWIGMGAPEVRSAAMTVSCKSKTRAETTVHAREQCQGVQSCVKIQTKSDETHALTAS
jgi:hypothetical protein